MKILLVYPEYPDTFWSFRHALKFIGKKAAFPPLGLLTVAAMLPSIWVKKLIDMNVQQLPDSQLKWADYVFISAMTVQRESVNDLLSRCRQLGVKTVVGGPLFTTAPADFEEADHLVLGEAEITLPPFIEDIKNGDPRHVYATEEFAEVCETPLPLWELIDTDKYSAMNIQYSRGCPFDCEFCDITQLFGRKPRTKTVAHLIAELEALYNLGWRGSIFFVDDNFIGDKGKLKSEVLPTIIEWLKSRKYPFSFFTEASIDLADDSQLMQLMVLAGFEEVFIGIETPHAAGLSESGKVQNRNRDMIASIKRIQQAGMQVQGGFIVGFDSDPPSIFEKQIHFIQESGIVTAMVGILIALRGTRLYQRLLKEGRLLGDTSGNNTSVAFNFIPNMQPDMLISGYRKILTTIYSPRVYYARVATFLEDYRPLQKNGFRMKSGYMGALLKSMFMLGLIGKERLLFWKLFFWALVMKPRIFPLAITFAIYGYHFRKITEKMRWSGMFDNGYVE